MSASNKQKIENSNTRNVILGEKKSDEIVRDEGKVEVSDETVGNKVRVCPGHERALPIQQTVMDLDVKEEGR